MTARWTETELAPDRSHHSCRGQPVYGARFEAVGKYHAPGLAPVRNGDRAWHIDITGAAAYAARYAQTFGFYEDLAAVDTGDGWAFIDTAGRPIAAARHAWCGNFQGGRAPVRDVQGRYFHVDRSGAPAYDQRWSYAGDYRDGHAVVQRSDGLHSHIDLRGELVHDRWFLDLDVFHKGYARARDPSGWTHVNELGQAAYAARFAAVEPFYNRQARVEGNEGELLVIDEAGHILVELRPPRQSAFEALSSDLVGYWRTHAIAAAVESGLFDALPGSAAKIGAQTSMTPINAARLLRALGELELVRCNEPGTWAGTWAATARGQLMNSTHPCSLADAAREYAGPLATPWTELAMALTDPNWRPRPAFEPLAQDPVRACAHHRMLRSYTRHDYPQIVDAIIALGLRGDERVIDAGGGLGALSQLLRARVPGLDVLVLERPEVVAMLAEAGVPARVGDLLEPWPTTAVDMVVLARVLHDWDDADARRILSHARDTLAPHGRVLIVEQVLDPTSYAGGLVDLHLLVVHGGRERDAEHWRELLSTVGLELTHVVATPRVPSLLEARRR